MVDKLGLGYKRAPLRYSLGFAIAFLVVVLVLFRFFLHPLLMAQIPVYHTELRDETTGEVRVFEQSCHLQAGDTLIILVCPLGEETLDATHKYKIRRWDAR